MKKLYALLISLTSICQWSHAQCPGTITQGSGPTCYTVSWNSTADRPTTAPVLEVTNTDFGIIITCSDATASADGLSYFYDCDPTTPCSVDPDHKDFNGTLSMAGGEPCEYVSNLLPLEFIGITSQLVDDKVEIAFQTIDEVNVDRFFVQKSSDQSNWTTIGDFPATNNANTIQEYKFMDPVPFYGYNYYRIQEVDFDGRDMYSRIVFVKSSKNLDAYNVFPNPSKGIIYIEANGEHPSSLITIIDAKGSEVYREALYAQNGTRTELDLNIQPGLYQMILSGDLGRTVKKLIIE